MVRIYMIRGVHSYQTGAFYLVDTRPNLNLHEMFIWHTGRHINVLCTICLDRVSIGITFTDEHKYFANGNSLHKSNKKSCSRNRYFFLSSSSIQSVFETSPQNYCSTSMIFILIIVTRKLSFRLKYFPKTFDV